MARSATQAECDEFMGTALNRLVTMHPQMVDPATGAYRDDDFADALLDAMIVWLANEPTRLRRRLRFLNASPAVNDSGGFHV